MSVFITYNHKDKEFAERLALELVRRDIKVWKDSWRIGVGDSLVQKIQQGLEDVRFFCVIFSRNSLQSEWVKRELTAALLREIEDRKAMILPVVIDDSKLPLFVRDKFYADFRGDFDDALAELLAVLLPHYRTEHLGRVAPEDHYYFDYSGVTQLVDGKPLCEIDIVSHDREETYSILTQIRFEGTEDATLEALRLESTSQVTDLIFSSCIAEFSQRPARVRVSPGKKTATDFSLHAPDGTLLFNALLTVKIVGDMHKGAVVLNVGAMFSQIESAKAAAGQ
ncbi:MAG TPA: toll/interleukin-1 receptor domain-containing protein [Anaerolineae bacterium]|nr:toll/interleukin-1 receptor domain-containing protein [Anaerolineae bacterium]